MFWNLFFSSSSLSVFLPLSIFLLRTFSRVSDQMWRDEMRNAKTQKNWNNILRDDISKCGSICYLFRPKKCIRAAIASSAGTSTTHTLSQPRTQLFVFTRDASKFLPCFFFRSRRETFRCDFYYYYFRFCCFFCCRLVRSFFFFFFFLAFKTVWCTLMALLTPNHKFWNNRRRRTQTMTTMPTTYKTQNSIRHSLHSMFSLLLCLSPHTSQIPVLCWIGDVVCVFYIHKFFFRWQTNSHSQFRRVQFSVSFPFTFTPHQRIILRTKNIDVRDSHTHTHNIFCFGFAVGQKGLFFWPDCTDRRPKMWINKWNGRRQQLFICVVFRAHTHNFNLDFWSRFVYSPILDRCKKVTQNTIYRFFFLNNDVGTCNGLIILCRCFYQSIW